jgi:hypothetical protein
VTRFFILLLILSSVIIGQEEESATKLDFSGSLRVRAFDTSRDFLLTRKTPTYPILDPSIENAKVATDIDALLAKEKTALEQAKPSTISKSNENLRYYDTRFLYNMNFTTSKYIEGLWGMQVGDIPFGGKGLVLTDPNGYDPNKVGIGAGGEQGIASAVNVQTNFLYINFRVPEYNFQSKVGLQLFSSAQGRVLFTTGTGINAIKTIQFMKLTFEGGALKARDRSFSDGDSNGFYDKNLRNSNIYFAKVKYNQLKNYNAELYNYYFYDQDYSDNETSKLNWTGSFNEFNIGNFSLILHGILNHGNVTQIQTFRNEKGVATSYGRNQYFIKGALYDVQLSYRFNDKITAGLIGIGTTGRPGTEKDGVDGSLKHQGYRTLAPGFAISNIGIDFTGGYALFNGKSMSGINEYGAFTNILVYGPVQLTFGYYQLWASKAPEILINRNYNYQNGNISSTYMGEEINFNIRWNIFRDLQMIFRSGILKPGDGLRALLDTNNGSYIKEAFFTVEQRF